MHLVYVHICELTFPALMPFKCHFHFKIAELLARLLRPGSRVDLPYLFAAGSPQQEDGEVRRKGGTVCGRGGKNEIRNRRSGVNGCSLRETLMNVGLYPFVSLFFQNC